MGYKISYRDESLIQILDEYDDCIYIILGKDKSLVVDLGMSQDQIKSLIDSYVSTSYDIICTHGHIDHVGRSGEFEHIYMSLLDQEVYQDNYQMNDPQDQFNSLGLSYIDDGLIRDVPSYIDLGDRQIDIVHCHGHTPGSIMIIDQHNQFVLTGDALGSGCGVWMQVDHALSLSAYQQSLKQCYEELKKMGVHEQWRFYGGHAHQEYQSKVSDFNPLNIHMIEDMISLCQLLINQQIEYKEVKTREFSTGKPYYAAYQKAEMIFTLSQL